MHPVQILPSISLTMGDDDDLNAFAGMLGKNEESMPAMLLQGREDVYIQKSDFTGKLPKNIRDRLEVLKETKSKLRDLDVAGRDALQVFSPNIRKRIECLKEIQNQHDQLEAKFFEERDALGAKYQKLYEPLYIKRFEVVNGVVEVEGLCEEVTGEATDEGKHMPQFWLTAMKNNEVLAEEITKCDEGVLKYLIDIKCSRIYAPKGFKLAFIFRSNPYFMNSILTKTYHVVEEYVPVLDKVIGTEIEWFPKMNLTQKLLRQKSRKGSKNGNPTTRRSFFNFFNPPKVPGYDKYLNIDAVEKLQKQLEQDYRIGSIIRYEIIPHAVVWFIGEAVFDDYDDEDEDEAGGAETGKEDSNKEDE